MPSRLLEEIMLNFLEGEIDVLVSTTIIESGIDVPNANTLIINRADRFGLAELHQLRGRVGRFTNQAYAYFIVPPRSILSMVAKSRPGAPAIEAALLAARFFPKNILQEQGCLLRSHCPVA